VHDWTLISILFDWKSGCAEVEFRTNDSSIAKLTAHSVRDLHVPRLSAWGPSVSVNRTRGPSDSGPGVSELESKCSQATVFG
jgi:hypothetical protein